MTKDSQKYVHVVLAAGAVHAARHMLGWELVYHSPYGVVAGQIVETEAYTQTDEASHSFRGQTKRNSPMFEAVGTIYIYFTYGMHYCVNIVTGAVGSGEAVLIRALEPTAGIKIMQQNRNTNKNRQLCSGPAKLVQALGITKELNGSKLLSDDSRITLIPGLPISDKNVTTAKRIGISTAVHELRRFYIKDNPYISRS